MPSILGRGPATRGLPRPGLEVLVMESTELLAHYLQTSAVIQLVRATPEGLVTECNQAFAAALGVPRSELIGRPIWGWLVDPDAQRLRERIFTGEPGLFPQRINLSDAQQHPYTLEALLSLDSQGFALIGEPALSKEHALRNELLLLNNEFAVLTRENARQNKDLRKAQSELERVYDELKSSHWHLKKIQEVLPICMICGKVRTEEATWDDLIHYFKQNSDFLSHSYCPECLARVEADLEPKEEAP